MLLCLMQFSFQMIRKPYTFKYFGLDPGSDAKTYNFFTHGNVVCWFDFPEATLLFTSLQSDLEIPILQRVQKLIENSYVDGRPLHHLPAAYDTNYTPGSSAFFITDNKDYAKFARPMIPQIARHRHIVVRNIPQEEFPWSLDSFSRFGLLTQRREIQGMPPVDSLPCPSPHSSTHVVGQCRGDTKNGLLRIGTLTQVHDNPEKYVLLALSLPLGESNVVNTPRLPCVFLNLLISVMLMLCAQGYFFRPLGLAPHQWRGWICQKKLPQRRCNLGHHRNTLRDLTRSLRQRRLWDHNPDSEWEEVLDCVLPRPQTGEGRSSRRPWEHKMGSPIQ
jgi:hypothetical protein